MSTQTEAQAEMEVHTTSTASSAETNAADGSQHASTSGTPRNKNSSTNSNTTTTTTLPSPLTADPTSNHALIVSSSRYWFNYRHAVNALSIYQMCRANGIPDENIVLMLADDLPSNTRNPVKNGMFSAGAANNDKTLYDGADIHIDYRGEDVTVDNFVRVLLGRQGEATATGENYKSIANGNNNKQRQLQTDQDSNLLIYLTGHGGDQFFKFQDIEEITSEEIARAVEELHRRKRYRQVLVMADTCQAFTLGDHFTKEKTPNVYVVASSLRDESSYAHHSDSILGLSVIERYTHAFMQFIEKHGGVFGKKDNKGMMSLRKAMVEPYTFQQQRAHIGFREDLGDLTMDEIPLSHFFASSSNSNGQGQSFKNHVLFNTTSAPSIPMPITPIRYSRRTAAEKEVLTWPVLSHEQKNGDEYTGRAIPHMDPSSMEYAGLVLAFLAFVVVMSRIC